MKVPLRVRSNKLSASSKRKQFSVQNLGDLWGGDHSNLYASTSLRYISNDVNSSTILSKL